MAAPRPPLPTRAVLRAPRWLANGNPAQHLRNAGLHNRPVPGAADLAHHIYARGRA